MITLIEKKKKRKGSRTTTLRILEAIEAICDSPGVDVAELAQKLKIPQPTLYKHIDSLVKVGFLAKDPTKRLVAGVRLRNMFLSSLADEPSVAHRRSILLDLTTKVQETTSLSVPNGLDLYYFDRVEYNWPINYKLGIGDKLPISGSASGLLYLSTMDPKLAIEIYRCQHTSKPTQADESRFLRELEAVHKQGFALDDEMFFSGMNGAAIPIRDQDGTWSAFLSMHGLKLRKDMKRVCAEIPLLREAGDRLERLYFGNDASTGALLPLRQLIAG